jgi:small subunit ribosomal protein S21
MPEMVRPGNVDTGIPIPQAVTLRPSALALSPLNSALSTIYTRPHGGPRGVITGMPEVIIHDDESFERALKRFKKKCEKAGILSDLRKHRHFEKPSEKRKRKMNAAVRKNRRGPRVPRG